LPADASAKNSEVDRPDDVTDGRLDDIEGVEGGRIATITSAMRAEALDTYLHPFPRPNVADIFSEALQANGCGGHLDDYPVARGG
jgi:hypothetical protein